MVAYTALPAETGPTWAPDQLSVWPVEGGRFGLDAHYEGATGAQRAEYQARKLEKLNLRATVQESALGGTTLRLGRSLMRRRGWRLKRSSAVRHPVRWATSELSVRQRPCWVYDPVRPIEGLTWPVVAEQ
jgi:hypothetical protein